MPRYLHQLDKSELARRAALPHSILPRPFLRWAGSKRLLLSQIISVLPNEFNRYYEPFLGSGSLFFLLRPKQAVLADKCTALIECYTAVRDNVAAVLGYLSPLTPDPELYYAIRANPASGRFKQAAEFIYLNKTCWNGLYRVNSSGLFNVPYGRPKTDTIIDPLNLRECADTLRAEVSLRRGDFSAMTLESAERGDLVYLDPPYVTGHTNNGFRDYNETLFSWSDQERLADLAHSLASRRVKVLVSNANHRSVAKLYSGFKGRVLTRKSTLAGDMSKRGTATEAIYFR